MYAVHIISTPDGQSFVGKGTASEEKLRAHIVPEAYELWLGPAYPTRAEAIAAYLGVRAAIWAVAGVYTHAGWYPLTHRRAVIIAQQAHPIPWAGSRPAPHPSLSKVLALFNCDQETLGAIIGASPAKMSRLVAGAGELSLAEYRRLELWAQLTGMPELLADTFSTLPEPQAPAALGLSLVGGTDR